MRKIRAGLLIDRSFFREVLSGGLTDLVSEKLADRQDRNLIEYFEIEEMMVARNNDICLPIQR